MEQRQTLTSLYLTPFMCSYLSHIIHLHSDFVGGVVYVHVTVTSTDAILISERLLLAEKVINLRYSSWGYLFSGCVSGDVFGHFRP